MHGELATLPWHKLLYTVPLPSWLLTRGREVVTSVLGHGFRVALALEALIQAFDAR